VTALYAAILVALVTLVVVGSELLARAVTVDCPRHHDQVRNRLVVVLVVCGALGLTFGPAVLLAVPVIAGQWWALDPITRGA